MDAAVNRDMGIGKIYRRALPEVAQRLTLKTSRRLWPEARRFAFIIPLAFFDDEATAIGQPKTATASASETGLTRHLLLIHLRSETSRIRKPFKRLAPSEQDAVNVENGRPQNRAHIADRISIHSPQG